MSKAAALAATGVGGGGMAIGGYYMFGQGSGSGKAEEKKEEVSAEKTEDSLLEEFKKLEVSKTDCIKDFSGLADLKGASATDVTSTSPNKIDKDFFKDITDTSKGCLKMKWVKKTYTSPESSWNGNIKLTWTFEKGNKGFIVFLAAKEKEKSKLGLVGLFYALSKTDSTWSITHKKEISTPKDITNSNLSDNFPQVGDSLTDLKDKTWWEFFTQATDLDKVCVESGEECKASPSPTSTSGDKQWTWQGSSESSAQKLDGWTKELAKWWKNLYGDGEIDMSEMINNEKGTWSAVTASAG